MNSQAIKEWEAYQKAHPDMEHFPDPGSEQYRLFLEACKVSRCLATLKSQSVEDGK